MVDHYAQKTLWHTPLISNFREESLPWPLVGPGEEPQAKQLLVKAEFSLISLGTEKLVISTHVPDTATRRMRVPYMRGDFNQSFTYGYSLVGTVIEGPANYLHKRIHTLHPHQRYAVVNASDVCVLPDGYNPRKATLISNMETAVNAIWDAQLEIGDTVVVIGYGVIGTLVAGLANAIPGINVAVLEQHSQRAASAKKDGFSLFYESNGISTTPNVVFNTAANSTALQCAIDIVGVEGTVIELSWHGSQSCSLSLGDSFHYDRKRIVSSQVSQIPQRKSHLWNYARRKQLVIKLLDSIDHQSMLEKEINYDSAEYFFNSLRLAAPAERGVIINYQE